MADDSRPPPPYAPTNDISFDWDIGTRTYGLRFSDDEPVEDAVPPPPISEDSARDSVNLGQREQQSGPPSAFWSHLHRQRTLLDSSEEEPDEGSVTQTIPFLELPAELRVAIYELICPLRGFATTFMARGSCLIPPPLAKTSRKVRAEVLPIFYGNNVFQIPMNQVHRDLSFRCLELVAPHVHLLKEVRSVAPEAHNSSWNVRFSMSINDYGKQITFTSQEPLTLISQQSIVRVLLTSKALHFRRIFNGQDFFMFFNMLRRGTVYFEIDHGKINQRNAEHRFDIRPADEADARLLIPDTSEDSWRD